MGVLMEYLEAARGILESHGGRVGSHRQFIEELDYRLLVMSISAGHGLIHNDHGPRVKDLEHAQSCCIFSPFCY